MKNFKKLFAVAASVMMLASTLPAAVLGASYSDELQGAYDYAYGIGITTQSSIDTANMYGSLIRSHMAKMMVNYAKEVLGRTADTSLACNFTDITNQSDELRGYIKEACQMGLMGQGITAFNPNGTVTRAQFGTVLSRALYGDTYNTGDPYYADHLAALKDAGIMNNISNPNAPEVRGYVMLMMQRADEGTTTPAICSTPENVLSCSLGLDTCPSECVTNVETNGTLNVSLKSSNGGSVPYGISSLPVATYKFTADEDVRIDSVTAKLNGIASTDDVTNAALFVNGGRISKVASFNSDDEAVMSITNGYTVKAGETVEFTVNVAIANLSAAGGSQFAVKITAVDSSAKDVNLASNLTSDTISILTKSNASVELKDFTEADAPKAGSTLADLFDFTLNNNTGANQDVTLKSVTFRQIGTIDSTSLSNFKLVVDGKTIATTPSMVGKYLSFNVIDGNMIKKADSATYTVKADINGGAGETVIFSFENKMDIVINGDTYSAPLNIITTDTSTSSITVSAGKVTVSKMIIDSSNLTRNTTNVFLGAFTIKNNAGQSLNLRDLSVNLVGGTTGFLDVVKVKLGSTTASPIELSANTTGDVWSEQDVNKNIGSSLNVYIYANTKDVSMASKSVKLSIASGSLYVEETENDKQVTDITYPSSWSTIQGTDAGLTLTNVTLGDKTVSKSTDEIEAIQFKIKTSSVYGATIKKITFTTTGNVAIDSNTISSATLMNGTQEIPTTIKAGSIVVDDDFVIAKNTTATLTLKVNLAANPTATNFKVTLATTNLTAEDTSSDTNPVSINNSATGRTVSITDKGEINYSYEANSTNNKYNKSILASDSAVVAEYNVASKYEAINVGKAVVTFGADIHNSVLDVQLYYGTSMVASDYEWSGAAKTATFNDIDFDIIKDTKTPLTVKIISKAIDENGGAQLAATNVTKVTLDTLKGKDSGEDIDAKDFNDTNKTFTIVPVTLMPAVTSISSTKGEFTLTASANGNTTSGNDEAKATLSSLLFTITSNGGLTGLTLTDNTDVAHYMVVNSGTVLFTITPTLANGSAGNLFKITPTTVNSDANYTVSLSSVNYTTNVTGGVLSAQFGTAKDVLTK